MIDFIKAQITDINISELKNNPLLNFCIPVNINTGEIQNKSKNRQQYYNAFYRSLEFRIYESGSVYVSGSLHKYWNKGEHNYNDFDIKAVNEVLQDIQRKFNIKPEQLLLKQLEIGVNFIPPYPTKDLLQYCFLHSTTPFVCKYNSDEGKYIQAEHYQYIIKIYDKARHYRGKGFEVPHPEIMRFEIKYKKLEKLKRLNIYTVADLMNYGLKNFVQILVNEWEKVLFYDFTINHKSKSLLNYKNPIYWSELKTRHSAFNKHKSKLKKFTINYSDKIQQQIANCIREKGIYLTQKGAQIDQENRTNRTPLKKAINSEYSEYKKIYKGTQIDTLYIRSILIPLTNKNQKICAITGINISMQKDDSFLLSHTGLKYYYKTDKKIFNEVKRKYLSDEWVNSDFQIQIREIAHNIRNKFNNLKLKQRRLYPENQQILFNLETL